MFISYIYIHRFASLVDDKDSKLTSRVHSSSSSSSSFSSFSDDNDENDHDNHNHHHYHEGSGKSSSTLRKKKKKKQNKTTNNGIIKQHQQEQKQPIESQSNTENDPSKSKLNVSRLFLYVLLYYSTVAYD
jgi:hypothetical protein